jgi:hypothetical protein
MEWESDQVRVDFGRSFMDCHETPVCQFVTDVGLGEAVVEDALRRSFFWGTLVP